MEDVLCVAPGAEPGHGQAGSLGPRTHDGQVLTDEGIEERGLPDVGRAGEGDVAGAGHGGM